MGVINQFPIHTTDAPFIKYDEAQNLTASERRQARENIGVNSLDPIKDFDGTKATYDRVMRSWFVEKGGATADPQTLTALCNEWYTITRTGWDGWVTFAQPDISTSSYGTKGGDNAGLVCVPSTDTMANRDDYAGLPLFAIKNVNWVLDENGEIIVTAIEGITSNFVKDSPTVYVGVMQMGAYTWQTEDASSYTHGYTDMSNAPHANLKPLPETRRTDGTIRPFMVHGKYMSKTVNGKMTCCSGLIPTDMISHNSLITLPSQNGAMYSGGTVIDWSFLVWMTFIKYGSMTQDGRLQGCVSYNYQYYAKVSETGVKRVLLSASEANNLLVGSSVLVGTYNGNADRGQASVREKAIAKITSIEDVVVSGTTYKAVYVDADTAFDTVANGSAMNGSTIISTWHWASGSCDSVLGNDGSPYSATNGKSPAMLQGIEHSVGGYDVFADTILSEDTVNYSVYYTKRKSHQATSVTANMVLSSLVSPKPESASWQYIRRLKNDGEIFFVTDTNNGSSSTFTKDAFYKDSTSTTGSREWLAFGHLLNGSGYGGLSSLNGGNSLGAAGWYYLAHLSPNGNWGSL